MRGAMITVQQLCWIPHCRSLLSAGRRDIAEGGDDIDRDGRVGTMPQGAQVISVEALYRRPNTSKPGARAQVLPSLLHICRTRPNRVWAMGMTYIPHGSWLVVCHRWRRLVQPQGSGLAALDCRGGRLMQRGGRGGDGALWQAGDLQYGPGLAVDRPQIHGVAALSQHRRHGHLARPRLRRAPREASNRRRSTNSPSQRAGRGRLGPPVSGFLQRQRTSPKPEPANRR